VIIAEQAVQPAANAISSDYRPNIDADESEDFL
jgi:hypothetical protein